MEPRKPGAAFGGLRVAHDTREVERAELMSKPEYLVREFTLKEQDSIKNFNSEVT